VNERPAAMPAEPLTTALALATLGVLMLLSAVSSRFSTRIGVPVALLFLLIGMVAGSDGLGIIVFSDYELSFRLGTAGLVVILFDGGLNTPFKAVKIAAAPAAVLATLGVVLTAGGVAALGVLLGMEWRGAVLLGAIVSSTDAASVFSVLRGSGIQLKKKVGATLELESGLNDPMALVLTIAATELLISGQNPSAWLLLKVIVELVLGGCIGVALGAGGRRLLERVKLVAGGLYPVMTTAIALTAFGVATAAHASGFLAVYACAMVLGNAKVPHRAGMLRVHDAIAWLAQVGMFLLLGLLSHPSRLPAVLALGVTIGLALTLLARPIAVLVCLVPFRFPWRERAYIAWVGLRGAVPILLATFPVMAHAPGAEKLFDLVLVIVVVNAIVPGTTIRMVTDRLGLRSAEPPAPPAVLEVSSALHFNEDVLAFFIDKASAVAGVAIADLPFPDSAAIMLIVRGTALIPPRGNVVVTPGDHLYVIAQPADVPLIRLMFGLEEAL
jgi:cell volume regulation protein A